MRRVVPWVLIALFLGMTVAGAVMGTFKPVYQKAKMVCRECIGIN